MRLAGGIHRLYAVVVGAGTLQERDARLNLALLSGTAAYFLIFSLIPALTAFVLFLSLTNDPASIRSSLVSGMSGMPTPEVNLVTSLADYVLKIEADRRTIGALVAMILATWGMTGMASALVNSIELYTARDHRGGVWKSYWIEAQVTFLLVIAIAATGGAITLFARGEALFGADSQAIGSLLKLALGSVLVLIVAALTTAIYRLCGIVSETRFGLSYGSLVAAALIGLGTFGFGFYVQRFTHYEVINSALVGVIILLLWARIISAALIWGCGIDARRIDRGNKAGR